ncbi:MAG: hypothetical protein ACE5OS_11410 [Anaerolineae bacterium]
MGALPPFVFLILTLAAFAVAGALLAWVIGHVSGKGKGSSKKREQRLTDVPPAESETTTRADEQELLRVSRTKKGDLAVFVQGQRYRHLRKITDPEMGRETIEALKAVLAFAEGWLPSTQQQVAPPTSPAPDVDQAMFLKQLRQAPPSPTVKPAGLRGLLPTQAPRTMLEPLTFVDEIDDLVQQRLQERPELTELRIRLTTDEAAGLRIQVNQQTFDSVSDIPYPQIRALIQDAIREWEGG